MRARVAIAAATAVLLGAGAFAYVRFAAARNATPSTSDSVALAAGPPRIVVRSTAPGSRGKVVSVDPAGTRAISGLACDRVYAAGGVGACLRPDGPLQTYQIVVLDSHLHEKTSYPLVGVPSRVRVSASGRMVAWAVFVTGDSYNNGRFSTRAGIVDLKTGELAGSLEDFAAFVDGKPFQAADLNYWGVTFTSDDNKFYVTMASAGHRYLAEGDFKAQTVKALRDNVECPSLSPDGTRIAFKQAVQGDPAKGWRLAVLDIASGKITRLGETRSVDDQAAWVDSATIAYGIPRDGGHSDVWAVAADGSGQPRLLVPDADSPAAIGANG